jgi:thiamine biosynthesis protein ThiS
MQITLNGEARTVKDGLTVRDLLIDIQIDPSQKGIAVAINAEIAAERDWASIRLQAGDQVDIIHAVQGGT